MVTLIRKLKESVIVDKATGEKVTPKDPRFRSDSIPSGFVDWKGLKKFLSDNGYKLVRGLYKDANHNRQKYHFVFDNGSGTFVYLYKVGSESDHLVFTKSLPDLDSKKDSMEKLKSYDSVHDFDEDPGYSGFDYFSDL